RHPESVADVVVAVSERRSRRVARGLHPGAVESRQADAAGRAAIRSRVQLVPRADTRTVEVLPEPNRLPGNEGRGQLQGLHAPYGPRLRRVRQRPNGAEG